MIFRTILIACSLLLLALPGYCGRATVYGTVKGEDGKAVEFCNIRALNASYATTSNEHGEFSLVYDTDSCNLLLFSRPGYESKKLKINAGEMLVVLHPRVNKLKEVVVVPGAEGKIAHGIMGKKHLKPFGICTAETGQERAIYLAADSTRNGELESVFFYITNEGIPTSRFRIHVYDIDTGYMPGNDLLDSVVILHASSGDEWVSANISSRHIPTGRGRFISMEWITGYGNNPELVDIPRFKGLLKCNGQVMSFTESYYKKGSLLYSKGKNGWRYSAARGSSHKNILNPMVYATYTYVK